MKALFLLKAIIKSLPGMQYIRNADKNNGGETLNASYCYNVWLRHLLLAYENGIKTIPKKVAEFGPGNSLGVGLAALISGADEYFAFDIIKYQPAAINLKIFDELVQLFKNRVPVTLEREAAWTGTTQFANSFPTHLFSDAYLEDMLDENRLLKIRQSIEVLNDQKSCEGQNMITYTVPWNSESLIVYDYLDMILSQAVLQHIDNIEEVFVITKKWLKPKGIISHCVDLSSVGSANHVQGHWKYSDREWKIMRGKRRFLLNRQPYSKYIELFKRNGFTILSEIKYHPPKAIETKELASRFKGLSYEDRNTIGLFIQARKA